MIPSTGMVSSQDGVRVTMAGIANFGGKQAVPFGKKGKKMRPGSIASGPGKGKFPITDQNSVDSAASLSGKAKGVSKAVVKSHIMDQAKKRGLSVPKAWNK